MANLGRIDAGDSDESSRADQLLMARQLAAFQAERARRNEQLLVAIARRYPEIRVSVAEVDAVRPGTTVQVLTSLQTEECGLRVVES